MGPGGETGARAVQHLRALSSVCSLLCLLVGTPFVANTDTEDASREIENKHKHARVIDHQRCYSSFSVELFGMIVVACCLCFKYVTRGGLMFYYVVRLTGHRVSPFWLWASLAGWMVGGRLGRSLCRLAASLHGDLHTPGQDYISICVCNCPVICRFRDVVKVLSIDVRFERWTVCFLLSGLFWISSESPS